MRECRTCEYDWDEPCNACTNFSNWEPCTSKLLEMVLACEERIRVLEQGLEPELLETLREKGGE